MLRLERKRLARFPKLAAKVEWSSHLKGDGLGYDVLSFDPDGNPRYIEVKTTRGGKRTPFFISKRELARADDLGSGYRLYRLFEFGPTPRIYELKSPLCDAVALEASVFRAMPR